MKVVCSIFLLCVSQRSKQPVPKNKTLSKVAMEVRVMVVMKHGRRRKRKPPIKINARVIQNRMEANVDEIDRQRRKVNRNKEDKSLKTGHDEDKLQRMESVRAKRRNRLEGMVELVNVAIQEGKVKNAMC